MVKAFKTLNFTQKLNKVFIIPNNLGLYFIALWATCFLLAVGYASNLLLFMAIMEFSLFFWWMITAHADTKQLKLISIHGDDLFAKSQTLISIRWNSPELVQQIRFLNLITHNNQKYSLTFNSGWNLEIHQRGIYHFKKIELGLMAGFWLFKTWKYMPVDFSLTVYPQPLAPSFDIQQSVNISDNSSAVKKILTQAIELDMQKNADEHTRANRINWKRFAQRAQLVERYGESGFQLQQTFNLDQVRSEEELSYLTYEIMTHFQQQRSWYLHYQNKVIGPYNILGNNKDELQQCLRLLAVHTW